MINYSALPAIYRHRMAGWFTKGVDPGPFLQAVLGGELFYAVRHASEFDASCLGTVVIWLTQEEDIPEDAWGSPEKVQNWARVSAAMQRARVATPRPDEGVQAHLEPDAEGPEVAPEEPPARRRK